MKERLGERFHELDVALLLEWSDGRRETMVFLIEETSEPRRFNIYRMAHYCLDLAELLNLTELEPDTERQLKYIDFFSCLLSEIGRFAFFAEGTDAFAVVAAAIDHAAQALEALEILWRECLCAGQDA